MSAEEINDPNKITPQVAEQKVSEAVDDVVVDDDFLVEDDGDFFWVIQRIAWGIIKTLLVLTLIGLMIWLVWGGKLPFGNNKDAIPEPTIVETPATEETEKSGWFSGLFGKKEDPSFPTEEVITPKTELITPPTSTKSPKNIINTLNVEHLAYRLSNANVQIDTGSTIAVTTQWLKEVRIIGDTSSEILRLSNPGARADRIESTIVKAEALLNQSIVLQTKLSEEFNYFFNLGQTANNRVSATESQISAALSQFRGNEIEILLDRKIAEQQSAAENLSQAKVRQTLLQNVQNFDRLLRQKSIPLLRPSVPDANSK